MIYIKVYKLGSFQPPFSFGALTVELVVVTFVGQQLIGVRLRLHHGCTLSHHGGQHETRASNKLEIVLGAEGGAQNEITIMTITVSGQAEHLAIALGSIVTILGAE